MECHHRRKTQEGEAKFTWPQVYLRSFLRSDSQCSYIHKNPRHEDRRWSPLPLPRWDICKKEQQAIQDSGKLGISHTQRKRTHNDQICTNRKKQFSPDRLDEFPNRVWLLNLDLTKCQIQNFPQSFGWISKLGLITQLRFDKVSNPNFSPTVWMNFQTRSDYPIEVWQVSNPNFPRLFGWISKPGLITQLRFDKCQIPIFPQSFGWISKPGLITQLRFDKVSNPNFSPIVWVNFQTGFDFPIAIWQMSNPNFSLTVWMNFQTGSDYPLAIWKSVKSQFFPDRLD